MQIRPKNTTVGSTPAEAAWILFIEMKKKRSNLTLILICVLTSVVFACVLLFMTIAGVEMKLPDLSGRDEIVTESNYSPAMPVPIIEDGSIKFDISEASVGGKIGSMRIAKLSGMKSDSATENSAIVNFKGQVEVTGVIQYQDGGFMAEAVCLGDLDQASLSKMPKMASDTRTVWFCFNDLEEAKKLGLHKKSNTTVVIDNYTIVYYPSSVYNTADLVSVIK